MAIPLSDMRRSAGNQIPNEIWLTIKAVEGRPQTMKLEVGLIEVTAGTQVRFKIDQEIVDEYAGAIEAGGIFPPLVVFAPKNSQRYILADGFHRLAACKKLGRETIGVEVNKGGVHEALHFALGANAEHGLRRSNADKRHMVQMAFNDPHYDDCSLREISEICRVSHTLVRRIREEQNAKASNAAGTSSIDAEVTVRPRKPLPTQNEVDRKELMSAIATIKSFPFSGGSAWHRCSLIDDINDLNYCIDWLTEALQEHVAGAYSESVNTQEESAEESCGRPASTDEGPSQQTLIPPTNSSDARPPQFLHFINAGSKVVD